MIFWNFSDSEISFSKHCLNCYRILWPLNFLFIRLTRICNPSTDFETSFKVMRHWKFSQKTKLKQKFFTNSEKEVGNFFQDWDRSENQVSPLMHEAMASRQLLYDMYQKLQSRHWYMQQWWAQSSFIIYIKNRGAIYAWSNGEHRASL